ncbi:MAG: hypothetical protein Q8L87_03910 [Anaerolineales bacterium]|nr:hypothetical protein [Anaerolineales bacterium]
MKLPDKRLFLAWLAGIPLSYIALAFLDTFYTPLLGVLLLTVVVQSFASLFMAYLFGRLGREFKTKSVDAGIALALFAALIVFLIHLALMLGRFPLLFDSSLLRLTPDLFIWFAIGTFLSLPAFLWLHARRHRLRSARLYAFVETHLGGILLAAVFFYIYFLIANAVNQPLFDFDDVFFDTDAKLWRQRFGTELYKDYYERTVHPFVLIVVRPWAGLIALFLKGNLLPASFVLIALTGALCVFLVWYFVKEIVGSSTYALLIAALFGASASQLVFGSLLETYGFLGATALIFVVLVLKDAPLWTYVVTGLAAFGITVSNAAQTVIVHVFVKRDLWQLAKYGLISAALIVPLSLLNNFVYPDAHPYLWDFSTLQWEEKNVFEPTLQRANYLGRVMALHSIVAPQPVLFKEDIPFIKIWMFRAALKKVPLRIARYDDPFSTLVVAVWAGLILLGAVLFLKNLPKRDNRFSFAFLLTLIFYFVLHMRYGRDVFLYSSNWTYAIVLALALAWQELSAKRWFQLGLLFFLFLLLANNSKLILTMLTVSSLHIQ